MGILKKVIRSIIVTLIVLVFASPLWVNKVPLKYVTLLLGKTQVADKFICSYPVSVTGDSMAPLIPQGTSITLDRCFTENDLREGSLVMFASHSGMHLGIIRHVLPLDPVVYKISNERPHERLQDIIKTEIIAIGKDIDTSHTSYQLDGDLQSLILDPDAYVRQLYLGKIPKGQGVETANVQKTATFIQDRDKFCMVVFPKKELAFVDTEIVNAQTQEIMVSSQDIVFNVRPQPNVNCQDFGVGEGLLNLAPGKYRYRFLLNHQALADIPFSVE